MSTDTPTPPSDVSDEARERQLDREAIGWMGDYPLPWKFWSNDFRGYVFDAAGNKLVVPSETDEQDMVLAFLVRAASRLPTLLAQVERLEADNAAIRQRAETDNAAVKSSALSQRSCEAMDRLTAAGCGKPGTSNCLVNMVEEIIGRAETAEALIVRYRRSRESEMWGGSPEAAIERNESHKALMEFATLAGNTKGGGT